MISMSKEQNQLTKMGWKVVSFVFDKPSIALSSVKRNKVHETSRVSVDRSGVAR